MTRRQPLLLALVLVTAPLASGCRVDMHDQPKFEPYEASTLFPSGTSALVPPAGTVARGSVGDDEETTGFTDAGELAAEIPIAVDLGLVRRGQSLYNGVCAPCHDQVGTGRGMIVRRGYVQPPSFHIDRLRAAPPGHFFDAITRGFGQMPAYASQIDVEDRWAIVAYIQALQLSQGASVAELSAADRRQVETAGVLTTTGALSATGDSRVHGAASAGVGALAPHGPETEALGGVEPGTGTVGEPPTNAMSAMSGDVSGDSR